MSGATRRTAKKASRRVRHEPPKVWHNPDVLGQRRDAAPDLAEPAEPPSGKRAAPRGRIVAVSPAAVSEREAERERLLQRLGAAHGRPAITQAADALFKAGHALPELDQELHLQLLEHADEVHVRAAIAQLYTILQTEPLKRPLVLDSRLRRIEELADEAETREASALLRRFVKSLD